MNAGALWSAPLGPSGFCSTARRKAAVHRVWMTVSNFERPPPPKNATAFSKSTRSGHTEDIITERHASATRSSFRATRPLCIRGKAVKVQEVAHEFGVEYVLEGGVR